MENQGSNAGNGSGVEAVEPGAAHRDGVTGPDEPGRQEEPMSDILSCAKGASRNPDDTDGARHDQREADGLLWREGLSQDRRREYRNHQRHDAGKQSAAMRSRSE